MPQKNRKLWLKYLLGLLLVVAAIVLFIATQPTQKTVRVLYLVPQDREYHREYERAIESCVLELQAWYGDRLGGKTFRLNNPIVEVKATSRNAQWYNTHVPTNGCPPRSYTFFNTVKEAAEYSGIESKSARYNWPSLQSDYVWLIYVDAPGGSGAGVDGVAVLPDHDLAGLSGNPADDSPVRRWIGGSGHELGHAFGLLHPTEEEHSAALMKAGYADYPTCYLTPNDLDTLNASPFLSEPPRLDLRLIMISCVVSLVLFWVFMRRVTEKSLGLRKYDQ